MATLSLLTAPHAPVTVEHARVDPVFVLGYTRSGTSLMCRLLLDHLGVNFGTESQFIVRYHQNSAQFGDLSDDARLRWLFEEISRERFFERTRRNFGFVFDIDLAMRTITKRTYAGVLTTIFEQFARVRGFARWGDKTPAYSRHLHVLRELFPCAQYIHVVRDGRDAALSLLTTGFGPKTAYEAAVTWADHTRNIRWLGETSSPDNFLTVRYEDLLRDPVGTLGQIAGFLAIRNSKSLAASFADRVRRQVWQNNSAKWAHSLSAREIECFEACAGDELEHFGYPLTFRRRTRPMTRLDSMYWRGQGIGRRLTNRKWWVDNGYKARLRVREILLPLRQPSAPGATPRAFRWLGASARLVRRRTGDLRAWWVHEHDWRATVEYGVISGLAEERYRVDRCACCSAERRVPLSVRPLSK